MNKIAKTFVAGSIVFGTTLGISVSDKGVSHSEAQAATTPYYQYEGNAGNDPSFLLNEQFKNGIKYGKVTFNGVNVSARTVEGGKTTQKYDQTFSDYSKDDNIASNVNFSIKGNLTYEQVKDAYGKDLSKIKTPDKQPKGTGVYAYQSQNNGPTVFFEMKDGQVNEVNIGYGGYGG